VVECQSLPSIKLLLTPRLTLDQRLINILVETRLIFADMPLSVEGYESVDTDNQLSIGCPSKH